MLSASNISIVTSRIKGRRKQRNNKHFFIISRRMRRSLEPTRFALKKYLLFALQCYMKNKKEDNENKQRVRVRGTQKEARTILNERIIRPNQQRVPFGLLSAGYISTKRLLLACPPCVPCRLDDCWHFIFI